jgi:hypothetical protein
MNSGPAPYLYALLKSNNNQSYFSVRVAGAALASPFVSMEYVDALNTSNMPKSPYFSEESAQKGIPLGVEIFLEADFFSSHSATSDFRHICNRLNDHALTPFVSSLSLKSISSMCLKPYLLEY